jgi:DnaJ-class molecular chaperone
MSLEKEIQLILSKWVFGSDKSAHQIAKQILSLPSGLEVVGKCDTCKGCKNVMIEHDSTQHPTACPTCHGTGEIVRNLTLQETVEWAIKLVQFCESHPFYAVSPDQQALILPSGECIRVKP